ncbi:hypothetical protein [Halobacillus halophilus]|uniref:hypothetical protein n=1 Tax=Halobacillus halophilus TaxID=1570 RepID=UPI001CD79255|nr:hypothetical protein [Halobacillus halophilus]MCA1011891.1 hypothetical protein [Halobacillus halophilus]
MTDHLFISFLWLMGAYWVVTAIAMLHMVMFNTVYKVPSAKQAGTSPLKSPAYLKTLPYQALYNVIVFPVFLWFYTQTMAPANIDVFMFHTVLQWTVLSILVDYVVWVLIPHKYKFTHKEFYVNYQPWISLIYAAIFVSHYITGWFV